MYNLEGYQYLEQRTRSQLLEDLILVAHLRIFKIWNEGQDPENISINWSKEIKWELFFVKYVRIPKLSKNSMKYLKIVTNKYCYYLISTTTT